jgi:Kef-type K+ transport system membrane component KefB
MNFLRRVVRTPVKLGEVVTALLLLLAAYFVSHEAGGHEEGFEWLGLMVGMLALSAVANLVTKIQMPGVLGCLVVGATLANGFPEFTDHVRSSTFVVALGNVGILVLLFNAGLHSSVHELLEAGWKSFKVATVGVVLPLLGGFVCCHVFFSGSSDIQAFFFGSTLTATSVGITMKVLKSLGLDMGREGRIILGAAVIDDVLGLMILAINQKMGGEGSAVFAAFKVAVTAGAFFAAAAVFGDRMSQFVARNFARVDDSGDTKILFTLSWMFLGAWFAKQLHLEPILGAFAAGWVVSDAHFEHFAEPLLKSLIGKLEADERTLPKKTRETVMELAEHYRHIHLEGLLHSVSAFSVSIFFVLVGMEVRLQGLGATVLVVVIAVATLAVFTKLPAGLVAGSECNWKLIGVGMIPRGEVGIVFAKMGLSSGILTEEMFATLVAAIAATTVVPIVWLTVMGRRLQRKNSV